jgi:CheY-like chemotaxis protein
MTKDYKILVVDDEPAIREIFVDLLGNEGYACEEASDGTHAIEILKKEKFDLLITDFRMPKMNGAELLQWCRQNDIHFPVIFITGNPELLPIEKLALKDCCAALLSKPIELEQILGAVEEAKIRNHNRNC